MERPRPGSWPSAAPKPSLTDGTGGVPVTIESGPAGPFLARLAAARDRLARHAAAASSGEGLTHPDPRTGERWDRGQVWAHLAEFQAFWLKEFEKVVAGAGTAHGRPAAPVPFGRTSADPDRAASIERDRHLSPAQLQMEVDRQAQATEQFLWGLDQSGWSAVGLHPSLGPMTMPAMIERFLIGHLEEHASQLDELVGGPSPADPTPPTG
jgi:DinB superfamily